MALQARTTISGKHKFLDLYGDEPVMLSLSFAELSDITQKNSAFSQSFRLPGSKNNNEIFNFFYNLTSTPLNFDPNNKFETILMWDGYEILQGNIRLDGVTVDKDEIIYQVTFYNQVGDLAANIGDKFLRNLDLSDLSHPYNYDVIPYSQVDWNLFPLTGATNYSYQDGRTMWGLYNIGYNYLSGNTVDIQSTPLVQFTPFTAATYSPNRGFFDFSGTPVWDYYFKPSIQIKTLYEHIVNQAGYKLKSDFFNTNYFERYYMPLKFLDESIYARNATLPCFGIGPRTYGTDSNLHYIDFTTGQTCNSLNFPTSLSGFTIPSNYVGLYTLRFSYTLSPSRTIDCDTPGNEADYYVWYSPDAYPSPNSKLLRADFICNQETQQVSYEYSFSISGTSNLYFLQGGLGLDVTDFKIEVVNGPRFLLSGDTIDYSLEFPENDYKQIDFITSINRYFNLVVVPDPEYPRQIIVEPIVDFIGKGDILNWTTKIDHLQPVSVKPTTSLINGTLEYSFKLDQDYANQNFKAASNRIFGSEKKKLNLEYKDSSTNFDFMFGSPLDITIVPAIQSMLTLPSFSKINQKDEGGRAIQQFAPFKILPRLLFRGLVLPQDNYGFVGTSGDTPYQNWYLRNVANTISEDRFQEINRFTTYPFNFNDFSHYTNWRGEDVTGVQPPEYQFVAEDLYDVYYRDYINDLISPESKIYSAKIYLYPDEIKQLNFNEKILVDNNYFRINKITNYNLLEPSICDIELIKLTKDYNPHRKLYYILEPCDGGQTLYSNSDLNYNLYAYNNNYVELYNDSLTYLGDYAIMLNEYDSTHDYQHYYISSGYTSTLVGVYPDCNATGRTPFNIIQETPGQGRVYNYKATGCTDSITYYFSSNTANIPSTSVIYISNTGTLSGEICVSGIRRTPVTATKAHVTGYTFNNCFECAAGIITPTPTPTQTIPVTPTQTPTNTATPTNTPTQTTPCYGFNLTPVFDGTCDSSGLDVTAYKTTAGSIVIGDILYNSCGGSTLATGTYSDGTYRYVVNVGEVTDKIICVEPTVSPTVTPTNTNTPTPTSTIPVTYYKLDACAPESGQAYTNVTPGIASQRYYDVPNAIFYVWDNTTTISPGTIVSVNIVSGQSGCP